MDPIKAIFYILSGITLFSALMVITSRNAVRSALFLVLAFFASAGLWLLAQAEFLAVTLVLVYVGAVMVLFLFVIMMINVNVAALKEGFTRYLPLGALVAALAIVQMVIFVGPKWFGTDKVPPPAPKAADYSNIAELGTVLYTDYLYAFELAAMVLLVAIIAAISLTFRGRRKGTKGQNPSQQIKVRREDRVRLVKMEAENS